jgi:hypothetical protein
MFPYPEKPFFTPHTVFFSELLKKPSVVKIQVRGKSREQEHEDGFVHRMLEDEFGFDQAHIHIPILSIFTTIRKAKEMKKVFNWLENKSYDEDFHISFVGTGVTRSDVLVEIEFVLKNQFLEDIPDDVDGFKTL